MHPVRFKVLEKSGEKKVYEILRVIKIEDSKFAGIRAKHFDCEIMFGAAPRLCQIKYELDTCKWVLYKI